MGLLDRYVNNLTDSNMGPYSLTEEDKQKLKRRGILQFGLQLLANPTGQGGVFQAMGKGLLGGANAVQEGGQDLMKQKYQADQMKRYKADQDKQALIDGLAAKHRKPDGTVDMAAFQNDYMSIVPEKFIQNGDNNAELAMWNTLNQGLSPEEQAKARRIKLKLEGGESSAAIQYKPVVQPDGSVRYMAFDPNDATAQVPTIGGVAPPPTMFPPRMSQDQVLDQANKMAKMGMPNDKIEAWIQTQLSVPSYESAPAPKALLQPGISAAEKARQEAQAKADVDLSMQPRITGARTTAEIDAKQSDPVYQADLAKKNQEIGEVGKRSQAAIDSADELIGSLDRLTASKGYADLGTAWGDTQTNVPIIRNDAKDSQAMLDQISGNVALTTMASLKALSSSGATGFGALTAPELSLLENSIAALKAGKLSHTQLDANIKVVKEKLQKIKDRAALDASAPRAPARSPAEVKRTRIKF